eukprot:RCo042261
MDAEPAVVQPTPACSVAPGRQLRSIRWDDLNQLFHEKGRCHLGKGCFAEVFSARCIHAPPAEHGYVGLTVGDVYAVKAVCKDLLGLGHCSNQTTNDVGPTDPNTPAAPPCSPVSAAPVPCPADTAAVGGTAGVVEGTGNAKVPAAVTAREYWRNLVHEIAVLKKLNSPHCVRLFDTFQDHKHVYLVLEYVPVPRYAPLLQVIQNRAGWSEDKAAIITARLIQALIFLHDNHVVHRDLKPDNILVDVKTLEVKLIDFGFAKYFGHHHYHHQREGGLNAQAESDVIATTPLGATKFLAPEILVASRVKPMVTTRTDIQKLDIFAVGVTVYLMLGGDYPFRYARSRRGLEEAIRRGVSFPSPHFDDVSELGQDFCRWLLNHDRRNRPFARNCLEHPWLRAAQQHLLPEASQPTPASTPSTGALTILLPRSCSPCEAPEMSELRTTEVILHPRCEATTAEDQEAWHSAVDEHNSSNTIVLQLPERVRNGSAAGPRNLVG